MRLADKFHDDAPRYITVLVHVYGTLAVRDDELAVAESEHTQGPQVLDTVANAGEVGLCLRVFRSQERHRPWLFLVQSHDLNASLRRDGQRTVEQVDVVALCRDIELVIIAEKFSLPTAR